jgi:hypothetical protein
MSIDFHNVIVKHGSLFDRGAADSYYNRAPNPHYYPDGSYNGEPVTALAPEEIAEYMAGYMDNEINGDKKDYT